MEKWIAVLAAAALLMTLTAFAGVPEDFRWEYRGDGRFEIEFRRDVSYENPALTVTDGTGAEISAAIHELDDEEITFRIENAEPGKTYAFTVSGVREGFVGEYGAVEGTVTVPEAGDYIRKVDCDPEDREIEIEFLGRVEYENVQVTVRDSLGTACEARIVDRDGDSLEVRVSDLTRGQEYTVEVSGVRQTGAAVFGTVSKVFVAR